MTNGFHQVVIGHEEHDEESSRPYRYIFIV